MRLLIYGFGPYRQFSDNITARILQKLPKRKPIKKIIFPVRFRKTQFTKAVTEFEPDIILGLGQCSRGRLMRIENVAANQRRNSRREKPKMITPRGAATLATTLKLNLGRNARSSRNAGDYVCNYSMYVILDFLKRGGQPIPFGFVHIPHQYDEKRAGRLLTKAIDRLLVEKAGRCGRGKFSESFDGLRTSGDRFKL